MAGESLPGGLIIRPSQNSFEGGGRIGFMRSIIMSKLANIPKYVAYRSRPWYQYIVINYEKHEYHK